MSMDNMNNLVKLQKKAYPFLTYPLTFSCSEGLKTEMLCHSVLLSRVSLNSNKNIYNKKIQYKLNLSVKVF